MRFKKQKTDDLSDALKQLKISDRRSRLSLRGRTVKSATSLDHTLRHQLTRSVSSATSSYDSTNVWCKHCLTYVEPTCNTNATNTSVIQTQNLETLTSSTFLSSATPSVRNGILCTGSGFSPFNSAAGLLYTTLPTNLRFPSDSEWARQHSNRFHRSYGTGLCNWDAALANNKTSISRSSFGSVATSGSDVHSHCIHHGTHPPALSCNQLKLYRRLYSLIDHPCVSLTRSCRSLLCPHQSAFSSRCSSMSHRHSFSLRPKQQHPVTPVSPFQFKSDSSNYLSSGLLPSVLPTDLKSVALICTPTSLVNGSAERLDTFKEQPNLITNSELSDLNDVGNVQSSQRCRRNSDPECWQQPIRDGDTDRCGKVHYVDLNNKRPPTQPHRILPASIRSGDIQQQCCIRPIFVNENSNASKSNELAPHGPSQLSLMTHPTTDCSSSNVFYNISSLPSSNSTESYLSTTTISDQPSSSFQRVDTGMKPLSGTTGAKYHNNTYFVSNRGDVDPQSDLSQPNSLLGTGMMRSVEEELELVGQNRTTVPSNGASQRHFNSDVSVNELAAYMEHMVHIPGRMSEMAQRMYL